MYGCACVFAFVCAHACLVYLCVVWQWQDYQDFKIYSYFVLKYFPASKEFWVTGEEMRTHLCSPSPAQRRRTENYTETWSRSLACFLLSLYLGSWDTEHFQYLFRECWHLFLCVCVCVLRVCVSCQCLIVCSWESMCVCVCVCVFCNVI